MRIGIDAKTLSKRYTGIAVYLHEMLKYFNELEPQNEYFLYSNRDFDIDLKLGKNFHKRIYKARLGTAGLYFKLEPLLLEDKIDVFWGIEHCLPKKTGKYKTVVTVHDLAVLMNPELGTRYNALIQRFLVKKCCLNADTVIAISNSTKNDILKCFGMPEDKIHVIYNGDSPYKYTSFITSETPQIVMDKFHVDTRYFLFVGSIEPRKNIVTIVKAFNKFRKKTSGIKLVLLGGLGWRYGETLKEINNSPFKSDIIQTGYCTEKEKEFLYRNAEVLLFPSLCEGFGLPVLEAMSVGTPVITANNSSLAEIGGKEAFYIDSAEDYNQLEEKMRMIMALDLNQRQELSASCIKRSLMFSRKECALKHLRLFHEINNK